MGYGFTTGQITGIAEMHGASRALAIVENKKNWEGVLSRGELVHMISHNSSCGRLKWVLEHPDKLPAAGPERLAKLLGYGAANGKRHAGAEIYAMAPPSTAYRQAQQYLSDHKLPTLPGFVSRDRDDHTDAIARLVLGREQLAERGVSDSISRWCCSSHHTAILPSSNTTQAAPCRRRAGPRTSRPACRMHARAIAMADGRNYPWGQ
jgi:hypothetical protein